MKFVIQQGTFCKSQNIEENQVETIINKIKKEYHGKRIPALKHELARFKIPKGVAIIFFDNRKLRVRNFWYEIRGLTVLARHLGLQFYHSVPMQFDDGQMTEIDGLDTESNSLMVELKQMCIDQNWIDFFEKKRKRLSIKYCVICAPIFAEKLRIPSNINIFKINIEHHTLKEYYQDQFQLPEWFAPFIPKRHVRILLNNGLWYGIKRKLTWTAKHTPSTKILQSLMRLFKLNQTPIRLYYSLSQMAIPQKDFFGRGYPIPNVIIAFDVDSEHKQHIIGKEGYCLKCLEEAKQKSQLLQEKLIEYGWDTRIIHSGFKGYHIYCVNEDGKQVELSVERFQDLIQKLRDKDGNPLSDNESFRARDGSFDLHRIFKLPNSVDAVTGIQVTEHLKRLPFEDQIQEIF